jgi:4-aminobutyrate aminotransferase-like enzyme
MRAITGQDVAGHDPQGTNTGSGSATRREAIPAALRPYQTATDDLIAAGRQALIGGGVARETAFIVDHGTGAVVTDLEGKQYIDCTSQAWSLGIGYAHPRVASAVAAQVSRYTHIRTGFETIPKLLLAARLAAMAPGDLNRVAFTLSGSDAIEGAMKLAIRNRDGAATFLSLWNGYHGRTFGTMALSWPHPENVFGRWMGPVVRVPAPYVYRNPFGDGMTAQECVDACVWYTRQAILNAVDTPIVGLMMEPFQGNGGMVEFPASYHRKIRALCDEFGLLLIWDEIQTAFGRMGEWFAADLYGVAPDIMVVGKGLGGGFPISAILVSERLKGFKPGDHSFTHAHFPPSMVAALATIDVMEDEGLIERSREMGRYFTTRLGAMQERHALIGDIRGPGLMIGIELVRDRVTKEPARSEASWLVNEGIRRGVIFGEAKYLGLGNIVKIKPPFVITEAEADRVLAVLDELLFELETKGLPSGIVR